MKAWKGEKFSIESLVNRSVISPPKAVTLMGVSNRIVTREEEVGSGRRRGGMTGGIGPARRRRRRKYSSLFISNTLSPVREARDNVKWGEESHFYPFLEWTRNVVIGPSSWLQEQWLLRISKTAMRNLFSTGNWAKFSYKLLLETTLRTTFWWKLIVFVSV